MSSSAPSPPSANNNNNNNNHHNHHLQNENDAVDKQRLIIALGVSLSIVALITMCLLKLLWSASFSIFLNNRNNQRRRSDRKPKKSPSERRLRKLDAESPTCTLQEWWSKSKVPPVPSAAEGDGQFICAICLESVLSSQEIRDLKCLHVFHKECLDKWYLQDQFHCPLCHRAYYQQHIQPANEFVWMV